jgi:FkbM family methyltransferase
MTPYVALQHLEEVFLLPTRIGSKVFATEGRSEFVVLERACVILRGEGRFSGRDTIVDVGAHIGTTTIPALSRQGFVRAVAIEPDPAHLPLLRANVALNQLEERVTVVAATLSDASRLQQPFSQGSRKGVVDLRSPRLAEPISTWTPTVRPVDDLVRLLPEGKKLTDVLVF